MTISILDVMFEKFLLVNAIATKFRLLDDFDRKSLSNLEKCIKSKKNV